MTWFTRMLAAAAMGVLVATSASAQSAKAVLGATPWEPVQNEPAARLIVDPPLANPLHRVITGQTVNFVVPATASYAH